MDSEVPRPGAAGDGVVGQPAALPGERALATWNAEIAFRSIVEATADKAGLEFMRHLVKNLARSLGVAYSFVAEFAGAADRVRTIAFWGGDDWRPNIEYGLAGSPCERVVRGEFCIYRDDVQRLFPADSDLVALGARSYLGIPLRGAQGQTLGHLAAIDTRPMTDDPRGLALFEVFANRARVEIERLHAEAVLRRACSDLEVRLEGAQLDLATARRDLDLAYGELQALLEINQSTTRHLSRAALFGAVAECVKPLLPTERFGIEVPTGPETLRVHGLALDRPSSSPMIEDFPSAGTACRWAQENRQWYVAATRAEVRERFPMTFVVMEREGMESLCALPLLREERSFGALFFMSTARGAYREIPVALLARVASAVAVALDNCFAYEDLGRLRDRLATENVYLQEEIQEQHNFHEIVGNSPALTRVFSLVESVAETNATVLIAGETGTGKELIARAIHARSRRAQRPLIKLNCAAIPSGLVESELFGHERGAFTGATTQRRGRFELADGGTIFLDEVGELSAQAQAKLLRVLQERAFERVGGSQTIKVNVRIIAATNGDLAQMVKAGTFRADLFYRLNVFPLAMPRLRERRSDIPLLARHFLAMYAHKLGKPLEGIAPISMERLTRYNWPGNVRELQNVIERMAILASGTTLEIHEALLTPAAPDVAAAPAGSLEQVARQHIERVLNDCKGIIEGKRGAAAILGLKPSTLRYRMKLLGLGKVARAA